MLTKIWTASLLLGLAATLVVLAFVCMRDKGFRPYVDLWAKFRRMPLKRQIAVVMFVVGMWVYASVKPGDGGSGGDGGGDGGGTNNIQMVIDPGGLPQAGSPGAVTNTLGHGVVGEIRPVSGGILGDPALFEDEWSDFVSITSTNTTRTLTGEDFRRGFVMTQIETGEEHDFSAPPDATIVSDWQAFGAATDWIYVALTNWAFSVATNDVERLRVYSFGKIEPLIREAGSAIATNYWFASVLCRRRTGNCSTKPTGQARCGIASCRTMRLLSPGRTYFSTATLVSRSPSKLSSLRTEGLSSATTSRVSTVKRLRASLRALRSRGASVPQTLCRRTSP